MLLSMNSTLSKLKLELLCVFELFIDNNDYTNDKKNYNN